MKTVRIIALVALALLAIGAIWGALLLIQNPTGSQLLEMPLSLLQYSPFHSFLIPGIILLVANGILPAVIFVVALRRARRYGLWIAFQGCVLFGWITIEAILLQTIVWLHYVYWGLALVILACGWALRHDSPVSHPTPAPSATLLHR